MADERDLTHDPVSGQGTHAADLGAMAATVTPGAPGAYPDSEADYWRSAYSADPYYENGRAFQDYGPAYELGWVGFGTYGGEFEAADRVLANDWEVRRGVSSLSWDEARPASRAAWQRAHNAREYTTDGSASAGQVIETLNDLLENAKDGELGFREAAEHTETPSLAALFGRRAESCRQAASELRDELQRRGGKPDAGGSVAGAAHRVWVHIRGLFGGASDETMLTECERGEDAAVARYRKALKQNLPQDIHAMVQRQFEGAQRNHDMIRSLRDRAHAQNQAETDYSA
ncbi:MAG: PA2169 family four-helix-bundle protein [Burkholderiales bacterium]|nr:PA2169 family four-helix-bundle protein [Burkholderiales bacterium]